MYSIHIGYVSFANANDTYFWTLCLFWALYTSIASKLFAFNILFEYVCTRIFVYLVNSYFNHVQNFL